MVVLAAIEHQWRRVQFVAGAQQAAAAGRFAAVVRGAGHVSARHWCTPPKSIEQPWSNGWSPRNAPICIIIRGRASTSVSSAMNHLGHFLQLLYRNRRPRWLCRSVRWLPCHQRRAH